MAAAEVRQISYYNVLGFKINVCATPIATSWPVCCNGVLFSRHACACVHTCIYIFVRACAVMYVCVYCLGVAYVRASVHAFIYVRKRVDIFRVYIRI